MTYGEMRILEKLGLLSQVEQLLGEGEGLMAFYLLGWSDAACYVTPPICDPNVDALGAARRLGWEEHALYEHPVPSHALKLVGN